MPFENPSPTFSALRLRETDSGYPHRRCLGNGTDDARKAYRCFFYHVAYRQAWKWSGNKPEGEQELEGRTLLFMLPNHQIGSVPQNTRQEHTMVTANKNHKNRNNT